MSEEKAPVSVAAPVSPHVPVALHEALRNLQHLFATYRPERLHLDLTTLQGLELKRALTVWIMPPVVYNNPRTAQTTPVEFTLMVVPTGVTFGTEMANAVLAQIPFAHLLVLCSKTSANVFKLMAHKRWETLTFEELFHKRRPGPGGKPFCKLDVGLVPQYRLLTPDERAAVVKHTFLGQPHQAPTIVLHDPIARLLGLCVGDMVAVTQTNVITGISTNYRMARAQVT
jgi:DNA-directed RNA polymerase subunit H (RpoH/RPB5)